jgi:hypothetical protein
MNKIILACLIVLCQFFSSCTYENAIDIGNINKFNVSGLKNGVLVCRADLVIENKSIFPFELETGELLVLAGENKIGIVQLLKTLKIDGHSSKQYSVDFTVKVDSPETGFISALGNIFGNKTTFRLKGSVIAKSFLFNRRIFIDKPLSIE